MCRLNPTQRTLGYEPRSQPFAAVVAPQMASADRVAIPTHDLRPRSKSSLARCSAASAVAWRCCASVQRFAKRLRSQVWVPSSTPSQLRGLQTLVKIISLLTSCLGMHLRAESLKAKEYSHVQKHIHRHALPQHRRECRSRTTWHNCQNHKRST